MIFDFFYRNIWAILATFIFNILGVNQSAHAGEGINLPAITLTSKRIDSTANSISNDVGASSYKIDQATIEDMPLGASTPLNQVLLQAPGVAQDSYGQIHIRGEHANLQYRINGVIIPESISGFGQSIDTRFFDHANLITGALPAAYGIRTSGVVDIQTKRGSDNSGGNISVLYGQHNTINPTIEYGGTDGDLDYYFTGQVLHNDLGIESPNASRNPIHDTTNQFKGFGYLSYLLRNDSKITLMLGSSVNHFEIPNNPNQHSNYGMINGITVSLPSSSLNETQSEQTHYAVLSYQGKWSSTTDYQISLFSRYTETSFKPDYLGDLIYNGITSKVLRSNFSNGLQNEFTYQFNDNHLIKYGLSASSERAITNNAVNVFSSDPTNTSPISILDNSRKQASLQSLYMQDEWSVWKDLTVNYGLRADHVNAYVSEGQISPRIGVVYTGLPKTTIHAGYARYFTPPPTELVSASSIALYQGTVNEPEVSQNDLVKSERSNYYDIGMTHSPLEGWTIGLDAYYKEVSHLLDEGQFGQALVFTPFNYSQGRIYGLELTNTYHQDNFKAYMNIATSRAMGKSIGSAQFNFGQPELSYIANNWVHLDHDQALTASAGMTYQIDKVALGSNLIFGSGMRSGFANTSSLPAYTTLNFSAGSSFNNPILGNFNAKVALINAFDRIYEIRDGSGIGVGAPQFGQRRSLFVSVGKDF